MSFLIDPLTPDVDFSPASVWAHARAEYLAGSPAYRVCDRYELALSTFRDRAKREGWRRADVEDDPVEPAPRDLDPAPATEVMIEQAWRAVADALRRGRAYEARTFLRLVRDLREEASRERSIAAGAARDAARATTPVPVSDSPDSRSQGAEAACTPESNDLAEIETALSAARADIARLNTLTRSGRASPRDLLALQRGKESLRVHEAALGALRQIETSTPPP